VCVEEGIGFHVIYTCSHLKVICEHIVDFWCNCIYKQTPMAFLVGSSVAGLGSQRVNADIGLSCTNQ
jgi:hypothetical protein